LRYFNFPNYISVVENWHMIQKLIAWQCHTFGFRILVARSSCGKYIRTIKCE